MRDLTFTSIALTGKTYVISHLLPDALFSKTMDHKVSSEMKHIIIVNKASYLTAFMSII